MRNVGDARRVGVLAAAGFVAFLLAEQAIVLHHRDDPDQVRAHRQVGALGAAGLTFHSFVGALAIGLAFQLGSGTGAAWAAYVDQFSDDWEALRRDYLERPFSPDHASKHARALLATRLTLHKHVQRTLRDERLRALFPFRKA